MYTVSLAGLVTKEEEVGREGPRGRQQPAACTLHSRFCSQETPGWSCPALRPMPRGGTAL